MNQYRQQIDRNHVAVRNHLKAHGVDAVDILKPLDLLCELHGYISFIEVKSPDKDEKYTRTQLQWIVDHPRFNVAFAKCEADALYAMKTRTALTPSQKDAIAAMLLRNGKKLFTSKDMSGALGE